MRRFAEGIAGRIFAAVYKGRIIKPVFSMIMAVTMIIATTPKNLVHSLFTHHHHLHHCADSLKDRTHVEAKWPNCGLDNISAILPFTLAEIIEWRLSSFATSVTYTGFSPTRLVYPIFLQDSRGPPAQFL